MALVELGDAMRLTRHGNEEKCVMSLRVCVDSFARPCYAPVRQLRKSRARVAGAARLSCCHITMLPSVCSGEASHAAKPISLHHFGILRSSGSWLLISDERKNNSSLLRLDCEGPSLMQRTLAENCHKILDLQRVGTA